MEYLKERVVKIAGLFGEIYENYIFLESELKKPLVIRNSLLIMTAGSIIKKLFTIYLREIPTEIKDEL